MADEPACPRYRVGWRGVRRRAIKMGGVAMLVPDLAPPVPACSHPGRRHLRLVEYPAVASRRHQCPPFRVSGGLLRALPRVYACASLTCDDELAMNLPQVEQKVMHRSTWNVLSRKFAKITHLGYALRSSSVIQSVHC